MSTTMTATPAAAVEANGVADRRLVELYADRDGWARKAILNIAGSGKFSSDRTMAEYATKLWNAEPCPVP